MAQKMRAHFLTLKEAHASNDRGATVVQLIRRDSLHRSCVRPSTTNHPIDLRKANPRS